MPQIGWDKANFQEQLVKYVFTYYMVYENIELA